MNSALREPRWSDVNIVWIAKLLLVLAAPIATGIAIAEGDWFALVLLVISGLYLAFLTSDILAESSRSPRTEGAENG